jgi:polysaccharide biosynthesis transport protein
MNKHLDETMLQVEQTAPIENDAGAAREVRGEPTTGELHFRELLNLLHRRSRSILAIVLGGAMLAFAIGLLIPPKFTAKAEIAIYMPSSGGRGAAPSRDESIIETHIATLLSRDQLARVVNDLLNNPAFHTGGPAVQKAETEHVADPAPPRPAVADPALPRPAVVAHWLPGPSDLAHRLRIWIGRPRIGGDETTLNVDELERHLAITQVGRSRIIAVRYTSTDPDIAMTVANRIAGLYVEDQREQLRASTRSELAELDRRIAELKIAVAQSSAAVQTFMQQRGDAAKQASDAREAAQTLQELEREAVAKGQLYHTLLRRQQELRNQQESASPDAYVLSLATTPYRPSSPNPFLFIFPSLIVFFICGSLLAVILEKLDRGLRSEREVNEALGVPCIGLVPLVADIGKTQRPHQHLLTNPLAAYAEALRSIAATMQLASRTHPPKVVLITSSLPAEGKTTLAVSLSASIAFLQQRVLLIDLDLKHPSIQRELSGKTERGILDLLLKNLAPAQVIQHIPELRLDYLPASRSYVDPLILLAGEEMRRLLHQLRDSYDCIIIDSSPVLGSTETRLLAAMADEILFVVKWGSTRRELAQNALNLLRSRGGFPTPQFQSVNAVIAQVDLKEHARYGFGDAGEYFLHCEKYSSRSSEAGPAFTRPRHRISTALSDAWNRVAGRHAKPAAGADDPGQSSVEASR